MNLLTRLRIVRRLKRQFYEWDGAVLRQHQTERVSHILAHARTHSPYYRRILTPSTTLDTVPKMDKARMMAHFDAINTAGLRKDDLVRFRIEQEREGNLDLYRGKFSIGLSSGTSGNRGLTVLSGMERQLYSCLLWARSGIPEEVRSYRVLFALRTNNPSFMEPRSFGVKLVYVDYTHPPEVLVRLINEKKLNILAGPPSLLVMIARCSETITHRIDVLISYAEVLDEETRAYLEHTLNAPVVQIYQGAEGFIGSTCRKGSLHLNEDTILVEQADEGDPTRQAQRVIVTDLYRTTLPIIRYSLDDVLELDHEPCECGSSFRVIKVIHGRADDVFQLRGTGGGICYLFPDYVRRAINQASDGILEYQAIQHSPEAIEIRLVLEPGVERHAIEGAIMDNLAWRARRVGGRLSEVEFNDKPPERNPQSRKLIRVVRRF
ncbi:F390 synthetase-related protein [Chloroflexota bacterium]